MSTWKAVTIACLSAWGAAFIVKIAVPGSWPEWIETVLMCVAAGATAHLVGRELIWS